MRSICPSVFDDARFAFFARCSQDNARLARDAGSLLSGLWRRGRQALRGALLPAEAKAAQIRPQSPECLSATDRDGRLDVARNPGQGSAKGRDLHRQDRLSRHVARLFQVRGEGGRSPGQRCARCRIQLESQSCTARRCRRSWRMGHDAANCECVLQRLLE